MRMISFLMAFGAASLFAASPVALHLGENATPTGEVVAFEAVTASNAPTVKVSRVVSVREMTNALFNATASGHYLMATNATLKFLSGAGYILVEGASAYDRLTLFI